jgi:hypothetical protein
VSGFSRTVTSRDGRREVLSTSAGLIRIAGRDAIHVAAAPITAAARRAAARPRPGQPDAGTTPASRSHPPRAVLDVPIATMTLARDGQQAQTLLGALGSLARQDRAIFAADGGSPRPFLDAVARLRVTLVPPRAANLVGQVVASLHAAAAVGAPFILYTEPDKQTFFDTHLDRFLAAAPRDPEVGIVLAARSSAAFATFPAFQQRTERSFNELCGAVVGEQTDYLYGPFLLNSTLVAELADVDGSVGWGWRPFLFNVARRRGYRIASIGGEYACPADQRGDEERAHRLRQLSQNADGLARSCP